MKGKFNELQFLKLPLKNLTKEKLIELLPKDYFDIFRVKDLCLSKIQLPMSQEDSHKPKSILDCLKNWEKYMDRAILPEISVGPDVCIIFSNIIIFIACSLRDQKVETQKIINNIRTTNPSLFYHTRPKKNTKKPVIMKGFDNIYKESISIFKERFQNGKLKYIIRFHFQLPKSTNMRGEFKKHQHSISYEDCIIDENIKIPSLLFDISQETIISSGIFSKNVIDSLEEKSIFLNGN